MDAADRGWTLGSCRTASPSGSAAARRRWLRRATVLTAAGAALLMATASIQADTASNELVLENNTASYRSVTLTSAYDVRLKRVDFDVLAGSLTGAKVTLDGDVGLGGLLSLITPRPVRINYGSAGPFDCVSELLNLNTRLHATCPAPFGESASRPRKVTISVG